ncbi:Co2+/Mg2+ efflux protein ApaG [Chloroflexia bacterium SDU3-3]|nr:Co2+/Mg2+ efflux protein ApaG [Chloroflexia bacterium SDU3-3]
MMRHNPFLQMEEERIRVSVRPLYLADHSNPDQGEYVFAYFVRIENASRKTAQLLSRHWRIFDSIGEESEVRGDGVVGEQPTLAPGEVFEYQSFCVLKSPQGAMDGSYRFIGVDDVLFDVPIPRFELTVTGSPWPAA